MVETKALVIERVFDASVEKVWEAWTEPERIKKWWGPRDFTAPSIKNDFREGGKYLYCMHGPAGTEFDKDFWSTGVYKEIVPMQKIVATDSFADEQGNKVPATHYGMSEDFPMELLLTVSFEEIDDKTRLVLRHEGFPAGEDREGAAQGWNQSLDKLAESLA
jgi:uncharacterized protein YndB with AHSA1/START domain